MNAIWFKRQSRQKGVVLLFTLIVLTILLIGSVAVIRSMNTSLFSAGNLAFRRDLVNQGEQAISTVFAMLSKGGVFEGSAATASSIANLNYSAVQLQTNAQGIPIALLDNQAPYTGPDISGGTFSPTAVAIPGATTDVSIRYVLDRLCNDSGTAATLGTAKCVNQPSIVEVRGGTAGVVPLPSAPSLIYRLTIRVDGPRNTQVFIQSSFSKPD